MAQTAAFESDFSITLQGISVVDDLNDLGAIITEGGIDRAGDGALGIRGGDNGLNALEGFLIGLDASDLDPTLALKITRVGVTFVDDFETGTIVNRNELTRRLTFGATGTGEAVEISTGLIDVSTLDLTVAGGEVELELMSIYGNDFGRGGFRITSFEIEAVSSPLIFLESLPTGSEGSSLFSDTSPLQIDGSGTAIDPNTGNGQEDYSVSGSRSESTSFNTDFSITIQGFSEVDTSVDYGAALADGGIDRDSEGALGIRSGNDGGIEVSEGYLVGIDASQLSPGLALQFIKVGVSGIRTDEGGVVASRQNSNLRQTFGSSNSLKDVELSEGFIDVRALDLIVQGGSSEAELVSIFGDSFESGSFRIDSFLLDIVAGNTIVLDSLNSGSEGATRFTDSTPLQLDANGNAVDPNIGNGFEDFEVNGGTEQAAANNTNFSLSLQGMSSVNETAGADLGAKLADGGIDRSSNGDLGIRDNDDAGPNQDGIDPGEGYLVGIDTSSLDSSLAMQITAIEFSAAVDDKATIVNRSAPNRFTVLTGNFNGVVDVSSLELIARSGESVSELVSIFSNSDAPTGFRIASFQLRVVEAPVLSGLEQFRADLGLASDGSEDELTPAGDGVENILKYAFNMIGNGTGQQPTLSAPNTGILSPTGEAGLPLIRVDSSGFLEVTYISRTDSSNPGVSYQVQFTNDLQIDFEENPSASEDTTSIDSNFERVTVTDSVDTSTEPSRFGRVQVLVD